VLFLADHLGFPSGRVHGVTTYLLDVLPTLKASGVDVAACFLKAAHPAARALREHGIPVHFLDTRRFNPFVVRSVGEIVRRGKYRVLHCTQYRASIVGRALARGDRALRAVLHVHDLNVPPAPVRMLSRALADRADVGIGVSRAACDIAVRCYHVAPEHTAVVHTGIDCRMFGPLSAAERLSVRSQLGIAPGSPTLCLVGRFHSVKGQAEMIRMLPAIAAEHPRCTLVLVGDGPLRTKCERLARDLGLASCVRFAGQRNDVARLLAAADLAVVPSHSEGLCRAAIEANLCGLRVVAYDAGGLAEALPEKYCGELVRRGDERAFVAAVNAALSAPVDAELSAARIRAATRRFGLAAHVDTLLSCYDRFL
jgi:glycosyltransferase involved in cell wall biosynthesis